MPNGKFITINNNTYVGNASNQLQQLANRNEVKNLVYSQQSKTEALHNTTSDNRSLGDAYGSFATYDSKYANINIPANTTDIYINISKLTITSTVSSINVDGCQLRAVVTISGSSNSVSATVDIPYTEHSITQSNTNTSSLSSFSTYISPYYISFNNIVSTQPPQILIQLQYYKNANSLYLTSTTNVTVDYQIYSCNFTFWQKDLLRFTLLLTNQFI